MTYQAVQLWDGRTFIARLADVPDFDTTLYDGDSNTNNLSKYRCTQFVQTQIIEKHEPQVVDKYL